MTLESQDPRERHRGRVAALELSIMRLKESIQREKKRYIEECAPCKIGDIVEIKRSTSKVTGVARSFEILEDNNVYVTSVDVGRSKRVYITKPYLSIRVIEIN